MLVTSPVPDIQVTGGLGTAHISSTTKFGPNSACLNPDYANPVSFIGQIHVIALNQIKFCIRVMWFHLISIQFQLSAVQSFNESHVSEAGENGCYLSVLVSVGHLQVASSLELFSNQKSLNSQDSHDVRSAATQTLARKHIDTRYNIYMLKDVKGTHVYVVCRSVLFGGIMPGWQL